jgi:hypothetical protein
MLLAAILASTLPEGSWNLKPVHEALNVKMREHMLAAIAPSSSNSTADAKTAVQWAKCVQSLNNRWILVFGDSNFRNLLSTLDYMLEDVGYLLDRNGTQTEGSMDQDKVYRKVGESPFLISLRFSDGIEPDGCALQLLANFDEAW